MIVHLVTNSDREREIVDEDVLRVLAEFNELAAEGRLAGIAIAAVDYDREVITHFSESIDLHRLIAALAHLQYRMHKKIDDED